MDGLTASNILTASNVLTASNGLPASGIFYANATILPKLKGRRSTVEIKLNRTRASRHTKTWWR
jgi:hypothetical protein